MGPVPGPSKESRFACVARCTGRYFVSSRPYGEAAHSLSENSTSLPLADNSLATGS
jgi:hypothetical protein